MNGGERVIVRDYDTNHLRNYVNVVKCNGIETRLYCVPGAPPYS